MPPRPRTDAGAVAMPSAGGARFPMGGQKWKGFCQKFLVDSASAIEKKVR